MPSPGERRVLRFGNYFLTDCRLERYRTMGSSFEFMELSGIQVRERSGVSARGLLIACLAALAVFYIASLLLQGLTITWGVAGTFTILGTFGYGYAIMRRFASDSIIVASPSAGVKWRMGTFGTSGDENFIRKVARARRGTKQQQFPGLTPAESMIS